jgi:hypothetical protein
MGNVDEYLPTLTLLVTTEPIDDRLTIMHNNCLTT